VSLWRSGRRLLTAHSRPCFLYVPSPEVPAFHPKLIPVLLYAFFAGVCPGAMRNPLLRRAPLRAAPLPSSLGTVMMLAAWSFTPRWPFLDRGPHGLRRLNVTPCRALGAGGSQGGDIGGNGEGPGLRINRVFGEFASRREADRMVGAGRVMINGKVSADMTRS
jgi:hypothetical protein